MIAWCSLAASTGRDTVTSQWEATVKPWRTGSSGSTSTPMSRCHQSLCIPVITHHALRCVTCGLVPEPPTAQTWLPKADRLSRAGRKADGRNSQLSKSPRSFGCGRTVQLRLPLEPSSVFTLLTFLASSEVYDALTGNAAGLLVRSEDEL